MTTDRTTGGCEHGTPGCICYTTGLLRGQDKTHADIRAIAERHDPETCCCGNCDTIRHILKQFGVGPLVIP